MFLKACGKLLKMILSYYRVLENINHY